MEVLFYELYFHFTPVSGKVAFEKFSKSSWSRLALDFTFPDWGCDVFALCICRESLFSLYGSVGIVQVRNTEEERYIRWVIFILRNHHSARREKVITFTSYCLSGNLSSEKTKGAIKLKKTLTGFLDTKKCHPSFLFLWRTSSWDLWNQTNTKSLYSSF